MTSPPALDTSATTWLAGLDPPLATWPAAFTRTADHEQWLLHDVRWTPGESCRLAYHVRRSGAPATFVAVDVTGSGWSRADYRDDPCLPGLAPATDPALVADRLGLLAGQPLRACRIEPVRYRPGARCVVRYDVATASTRAVLYAKVFRPETFAPMSSLSAVLAACPGLVGVVPETVAVWPELHLLISKEVRGRTVSAVLADAGLAATERTRLAHRLGGLLARFHAQAGVTAASWSAGDQVAALAASMGAVRHADARLGQHLGTVLDGLAATVPEPNTGALTHGAFRPGQVLQAVEGRLVMLDTDGVSRSDPERDLGTVLAHLFWQEVRQPQHRQTLRGAVQALLSGYEAQGGTVDQTTLCWWRAAALLQVAARRYRRLEVTTWPLVPALAVAAEEQLVSVRGDASPVGAADLLDRRRMSTLLRPALALVATSPQTLEVESVDELATASGRRSVVRYQVRGLDRDQDVWVVGKVFTDSHRARLLHEHMTSLHSGPFRHGPLHVPEPLGLLDEHHLVLYRQFDGVRLDRVTDLRRAECGVRLAARWLARLHASDVRLPRRFSVGQESASTQQWAALVGRAHPPAAKRAVGLAERWVRRVRTTQVAADVPLHKDFHPGHVLVGDDGVCVIDLDEARQGDPAFDLAHFCVYLQLCGLAGDSDDTLRRAFLDEYIAARPWSDEGTFAAFCAYGWLKVAKQWAVSSGPWRQRSEVERVHGIEHALVKAETCLNA